MFNRRKMLGLIPASSLAWLAASQTTQIATAREEAEKSSLVALPRELPLLVSPPVVQLPAADRFAVSFAVSRLATGWLEWGLTAGQLDHKAVASYGGLIDAGSGVMVVPVELGDCGGPGRRIFYRVAAQPLTYRGPYSLHRDPPVFGPTCSVTLPDPSAGSARLAVINDTHQSNATLRALASRIEVVAPQLLVWNGDTCASAFDRPGDVQRVLLHPGAKAWNTCECGWASTRPLLFVPGNHDKRGEHARDLRECLAAGPEPGLPFNFAMRHGPLALIGLDTGEDKPDAHSTFGGTAAYEPYRARQAPWLRAALKRAEIASAPFKVVFCHIPLRGLSGQNDGSLLEGYAAWCGDGARHWMPLLRQAGVQLVVSGHTHNWRVDEPSDGLPMQVVGGGPEAQRATLTVLEADGKSLSVAIQNLAGHELARRVIPATHS